MKTLYVSDLDGTLLSPDSVITPRSAAIINDAIAAGALFSVATARTPATVATLTSGIRMNLPAIVMTGSALWDRDSGRYSHIRYITPDDVARLREIYEAHGLGAFIYRMESSHLYIYHQGNMSELERKFMEERSHSPYKTFLVDPATGHSDIPSPLSDVVLMFGIQPTAPAREALAEIKTIEGVNPMFYHDFGPDIAELEAFSRQASKADAVEILRKSCGADRVVAFGDNVNDLSMLRAADVAVAVAGAVDEVKSEADIIIGSNADDAVARFIAYDFAAHGA